MVTAYEKFEKDFVNGNKKGSFDVTGDAWRALVSKENKTEEEQKQIVTDYKKAFANFGEAYINKLDAEFGNGDGSLTEKEFIQTQISDVDSPDEDAVSAARNIFNHADINDDGKVDKKEMAAMFSLFDMARANSDNGSKEGQLNGKLYAPDIQAYSEILINPNSGDTANIYKAIDEKLKSRYNNLFGDKQ